MVKVKICGLRRPEDIEYVNVAKPDYIGFIFAKSKRRISSEYASELGKKLDISIKKVGVFVNESPEEVMRVYREADIDIIQLHGDETLEYIDGISEDVEIWKAVRVRNKEDIVNAEKYAMSERISGVLLDAYHESDYGGLGINFDWNLVKRDIIDNLILAGGLNSDNIERAVKICSPEIVDVSSGVETDGFKDENKINCFVEKVRNI